MRTENVYCDLCKKMTTSEGNEIEKLNGFSVEIGYSKGGWGSRRDFIRSQSIEVCNDCFKTLEDKSIELSNVILKCKNKNTDSMKPTLISIIIAILLAPFEWVETFKNYHNG